LGSITERHRGQAQSWSPSSTAVTGERYLSLPLYPSLASTAIYATAKGLFVAVVPSFACTRQP
jgi:hypothetical protein